MSRTHLPLYWQLPVLREAEGKFAEDSAMEDSDGNTHKSHPLPPGTQLRWLLSLPQHVTKLTRMEILVCWC